MEEVKIFSYLVDKILKFSGDQAIIKALMRVVDSPWFQRLRDISQTGFCRLVFPFSENSRFGHSLHSCFLMTKCMEVLRRDVADNLRVALIFAALLHDIGHLAPGSHSAWRAWFGADHHEQLASRIIGETEIADILSELNIIDLVIELITEEKRNLPKFAYSLIAGDAWNVDRGSWIYTDGILSGVGFGLYNIDILIESICLVDDLLCFKNKRSSALLEFLTSRYAMYTQVFYHPMVLSGEVILKSLIKFLRSGVECFSDEVMRNFINAKGYMMLELKDIRINSESWFRYHLLRWRESSIPILSDLSDRLLNRRLFKAITVEPSSKDYYLSKAYDIAESLGLSSEYYVHLIKLDLSAANSISEILILDEETGKIKSFTGLNFQNLFHEPSEKNYLFAPSEVVWRLKLNT